MIGFPSEDTFRSIFASKPIFIYDTNIFLNLLRYSKESSSEILRLYSTVSKDIRIPAQVYKEFSKNLPIVSGQRSGDIKSANTEIKNAINNCSSNIQKQLDIIVKRKFKESTNIINKAVSDLLVIKGTIDDYIEDILKDKTAFLSDDDVYAFVNSIWTSEDNFEYTPSRLLEIYKEGELRFQYLIPPGYMDDPKNNKDSKKTGVDIFGDLVLWKQIIDFGCKEKRPFVFVTADNKEDWFELSNSKHPISQKKELIDEFNEQTRGLEICILTSDLFVEFLGKIQSINTEQALLEMQMDEFVDTNVRKNKQKILSLLYKWANEGENILQLPFPEDINRLTSIKNMRIVVNSTTLQMKEKIEYSAILQGAADFSGINFDSKIKHNTNGPITSSFMFEIRITFSRNYEHNQNGQCIPSNEINDIKISNAFFEAVPSVDVSLESKRGMFILPTANDNEIFKYMESIWGKYERKYQSTDKAEALVYFDTANHFDCSLLEVNRAYVLVQNQKSGMNLSLNEIDTLALRRFSDIRININNGIASFLDRGAPLGEAYPVPDNLKLQPPEEGKELVATFNIEINKNTENHLHVLGSTNLPPSTILMISLISSMNSYHAQSKMEVDTDGKFSSDVFSDSNNTNGGALLSGKYTLEIVTPIVSVQPDSVKVIMGAKGRNLSGIYVVEDSIFGKTVRFKKDLEI